MSKTIISFMVLLLSFVFNACSSVSSEKYELWKNIKSIKMKTQINSHILEHNGNRIHYYVSGVDTNDVILFLHPAFGDHRAFNQQIDYFSSKYKVITIDLIGHGLSKVKNSEEKIDKSTEHIKMILEKEGCKKVHVIGVSMGSLIAQYFALQHPEKIYSITVLGGYDINKIDEEVSKFQNKGKLKWIFQAIFAMDSFRKDAVAMTAKNSDSQARFYEMTKLFTRKSFMIMSGLDEIVKDRKNVSVNYPLLILVGDNDIALAQKIAKAFHSSIPKSEFYLITNAGHCANMDNEKGFNKRVMDFLTSVEINSNQ